MACDTDDRSVLWVVRRGPAAGICLTRWNSGGCGSEQRVGIGSRCQFGASQDRAENDRSSLATKQLNPRHRPSTCGGRRRLGIFPRPMMAPVA